LPTFNQVEKLLYSLRREHFAFIEVCELLMRYYKPEPTRLRPTDRMIAHTGYLIFARRIEPVKTRVRVSCSPSRAPKWKRKKKMPGELAE